MRPAWRPLAWQDQLPTRPRTDITEMVIHGTEEPSLTAARRLAESSLSRVAGHVYIDRDGSVQQWIDIDRVANHAFGHNPQSVGIEVVNTGRWPRHFDTTSQTPVEPFPDDQIDALLDLLNHLRSECPRLVLLSRHSDLDRRRVPATDDPGRTVRRRIDPGPLFPWRRVREAWDLDRPA